MNGMWGRLLTRRVSSSPISRGRLTIGRGFTTRPARNGGILVEAAMFIPVLVALLIGTVSIGKITYTYYMLQRTMYNLARYLGTQQGVNFCDDQDQTRINAINFALTGTSDASENPEITGLRADMFRIRIERFDAASGQMVECECSAAGCDPVQGGQSPGFITVSLIDGYTVAPVFWGFQVSPFPLRPSARVPYAGT